MLLLSEEFERGEVFAQEAVEAARYPWQRVQPEVRQVPSGRLRVEVVPERGWERAPFWADRKRWVLESRLELMFEALEGTFTAAGQARLAREDARLRRRAQWEQARPEARARFVREMNVARLEAQAAAYARAVSLRTYASALESHSRGHEDSALVEWARFARQEADRLDPLTTGEGLALVEPEDIPEHELDRFMPSGMSYRWPPDEGR